MLFKMSFPEMVQDIKPVSEKVIPKSEFYHVFTYQSLKLTHLSHHTSVKLTAIRQRKKKDFRLISKILD